MLHALDIAGEFGRVENMASEIDKLKKSAEAAKNRYETAQNRLDEKLAKVDERANIIWGRAARKALAVPSDALYDAWLAIKSQMTAAEIEWLEKNDR